MEFSFDYFDDGLRRLGTRCEKWDLMEQELGKGMLPLWVADMDFPSPPAVQEALLKRAAHPTYGYTEPLADDYEAVAAFWLRRHGLRLEKEDITLLPCVVTGLKACVRAFTQPKDGVIIQPPVYGPFYSAIRQNGRRVLENPLIRDETGRYHMDLCQLEALLKGGGKMLLLCSPHNPASRLWDGEELARLLALIEKYQAILVADEIHGDFVYAPKRFVPVLSLTADRPDARVVTLAAASKTFNLAGLQQACLFTRHPKLREEVLDEINGSGVRSGNIFALEGTRAAYAHGDQWLDGLIAYLDAGRKILADELLRQLPKAVLTPVEATYLAWIDMRAYGFSTGELMERAHKERVALTEGTFFGRESGEGFLRFNFGCPHRNILEGVKRLRRAVDAEQPE